MEPPLAEASRSLDSAGGVYLTKVSKKFIESPDFEQKTKGLLDPEKQAAARARVAGKGPVTDKEFADAKALLKSAELLKAPGSIPNKSWVPLMIGAVFLSIAWALHLVWLIATGQPFGLKIFGMALVDSKGRKPARLRVIARSLIGFLPLGVALVLIVPTIAKRPGFAAEVGGVMLLIYIIGVVSATSNPRRGIPERLLGLFVVLR
jgi:uncharacterized RDD family membrane protein YckC